MKLRVTKQAAQDLSRQYGDHAIIRIRVVRPTSGGREQATIVFRPVKKIGQAIASDHEGQMTFYVDYEDEWFFSGKLLTVDLREGSLSYQLSKLMVSEQPTGTTRVKANQQQSDATTSASQLFEELWD